MKQPEQLKRVAYSPGEFAMLFGKSQTWGYRQVYGGKVVAITEHGRMMIPAKEVERVLESAGIYNGMEKPKQAADRVKQLAPEQQSIWRRYVEMRRQVGSQPQKTRQAAKNSASNRQVLSKGSRHLAVARVARAWNKRKG